MNEDQLSKLLQNDEDYGLEFKTANSSFSKAKLNDYCAAIANEDGGYLLLGVRDDKVITGTNAFSTNWNTLAQKLTNELGIRIRVYKIMASAGRVLVFEIPKHSSGQPVIATGGTRQYRYPIRNGESLVEMDDSTLRMIHAEDEPDWSAETIDGVTTGDLDQGALAAYRKLWADHTRKPERETVNFKEMLELVWLIQNDKITKAALLLFGTEALLSRLIPDSEIIFEWRNSPKDIAYGERMNCREAFILARDKIWNAINNRNTVFRYQEGLIQYDIKAFNEDAIREALINAFAHRDYRISGRSITIKASPKELYIENPGRLMPGVTIDNLIDSHAWRNRRLAEALEKVNIMERSSQGVDKIFKTTIEDGKGLPVYTTTSEPSVTLTIPATFTDTSFIKFLEAVANKYHDVLTLKEMIELEEIRQGKKDKDLIYRQKFVSLGIIEKVGKGRGSKYILSHNYYQYTNSTGIYTRMSGLTRDVKRSIILEHLKKNGRVANQDLQEAMPDMTMNDITTLLKAMKKDGLIEHEGSRRFGYWIEAKLSKAI